MNTKKLKRTAGQGGSKPVQCDDDNLVLVGGQTFFSFLNVYADISVKTISLQNVTRFLSLLTQGHSKPFRATAPARLSFSWTWRHTLRNERRLFMGCSWKTPGANNRSLSHGTLLAIRWRYKTRALHTRGDAQTTCVWTFHGRVRYLAEKTRAGFKSCPFLTNQDLSRPTKWNVAQQTQF